MRGERVKVGESCTLVREKRIRAGAWSGKGGLHRKEGRFQGEEEREGKQEDAP